MEIKSKTIGEYKNVPIFRSNLLDLLNITLISMNCDCNKAGFIHITTFISPVILDHLFVTQ